ncbi:hypothetical protein INT47_006888 [Mucor saturninus]|uniref:Uncharacterized protein n=1 Tax=Mucor saturninus TaxID=64648 RepID=A0A8H7V8K6_9FUNG|nr:hypothetical protein INT47_006888 [Mucor saturninus]
MTFPSYVIAIIIIAVILAVSTSVYFIFRKRKGGSVGAVEHQSDEYSISEKNETSPYTDRHLMQHNNNIDTTSTLQDSQTSSTPTIPITPVTAYEKHNMAYENNDIIRSAPVEDDTSSVWTASDNPITPADLKISLPLPPPNSSFFSDKMELDSVEANDLYASYMNVAAAQQDYVSIDLDEKPFLSNAAANIQQKAATLRTNLCQSLRRKSTSGGVPKIALNQFFDATNVSNSSLKSPRPESTRMSRQSSSTSSRFPRPSLQQTNIPPSPRPDSPAAEFFGKFGNNSKKSLVSSEELNSSNKTMIENIPPESYFSLPLSPTTSSPLVMRPTIQQQQDSQYELTGMRTTILQQQQQQQQQQQESQQEIIGMRPTIKQQQDKQLEQKQALNQKQQDVYSSMIQDISNTQEIEESDEEEPDKEDAAKQEDPALAARRLIRSASRKSRTRSTLITDEAAQAMFALIASSTPSPSEPIVTAKYATLRKHNMEIDTASIQRNNSHVDSSLDIQKWSMNEPPKSPGPKRAIMSSTVSGSATVSGKRMAKNQQLNAFNKSSEDLLKSDLKSATLGRKKSAETTSSGPKSLRNLFTRPSADDKSSIVSIPSVASTSKEQIEDEVEEQEEVEAKEDVQSAIQSISDVDTATPNSPITSTEPSPYSSKNNTVRKMGNNVDTIRRMLQSSWSGNNLKESGSSNSLSSSSDNMGSVGSSYRPVASPLGSVNPRMQNQHLVSLSLKATAAQQGRNRPSMPIGFMNDEEGPMPTASFSSSTVRTMIPADEEEVDRSRLKPKSSVMGNILGSRQPRQPSKLGDRKGPIHTNNKKQSPGKKTPAQIEREKYLKSSKT